MELNEVIQGIRGKNTLDGFAHLLTVEIARSGGDQTVSASSVCRWEKERGDKEARVPKGEAIAALLRVAEPPQQAALLETLGIDDAMQFAADLLASAGVTVLDCKGADVISVSPPAARV
jgi:hypothetical protein